MDLLRRKGDRSTQIKIEPSNRPVRRTPWRTFDSTYNPPICGNGSWAYFLSTLQGDADRGGSGRTGGGNPAFRTARQREADLSGNVIACAYWADAGTVYGALPGVNLQLEATNRRVDVVGEGVDVAIRVRPRPIEDSDLVMRVLPIAAPSGRQSWLVERQGQPRVPSELSDWPGLSLGAGKHQHKWQLTGPEGARAEIYFTPRLVTTDMLALREAAIAGVGVVQPLLMVRDQLAAEELVVVLMSGNRAGGDPCGVCLAPRAAALGQGAG